MVNSNREVNILVKNNVVNNKDLVKVKDKWDKDKDRWVRVKDKNFKNLLNQKDNGLKIQNN